MFKKIFKFLGLANNPEPIWNSKDYTYHILNGDLSDERYKKKFAQWMPTYLEKSENLTEKKYKLLFIHALLQDKHQDLYSIIPDSSDLMENIGRELIENNETKLQITDLFPIDPFKGFDSYCRSKILKYEKDSEDDDFSFLKDFINEDEHNSEKLVIARKVYKDFENLGLLGNALINNYILNLEFLVEVQQFKLNISDEKKIIDRLSILKENPDKNLYHPTFCTDEYILEKLILNEDDENKLKILQNFYFFQSKVANYSVDEDDFNFDNFNNIIKTKIDYLILSNEINPTIESQNIKAKKVKI